MNEYGTFGWNVSNRRCLICAGAQLSSALVPLCFYSIFKYLSEFIGVHKYCAPEHNEIDLKQNRSLNDIFSFFSPVFNPFALSYQSAYICGLACSSHWSIWSYLALASLGSIVFRLNGFRTATRNSRINRNPICHFYFW